MLIPKGRFFDIITKGVGAYSGEGVELIRKADPALIDGRGQKLVGSADLPVHPRRAYYRRRFVLRVRG